MTTVDEQVIIHYANHISDYCKRMDECEECPFFAISHDNETKYCQFEIGPDSWREELKRTHE